MRVNPRRRKDDKRTIMTSSLPHEEINKDKETRQLPRSVGAYCSSIGGKLLFPGWTWTVIFEVFGLA